MIEPYSHLSADWPGYRWDDGAIAAELASIHTQRGSLFMAMQSLGFAVRQETCLRVITDDVAQSSKIEGEHLDEGQVRSSIARKLGMDYAGLPEPDRTVDGIVEMMLDATQQFDAPLDLDRILGWHACLFPAERSGMRKIRTGAFRDDRLGPMQIVSGPEGRQRVHFEAPAADRLPQEMDRFLAWFETEKMDPVVKAAIAHLWFVTIHPFDDGNGRIGRAIMDMALARADGDRQRFYSMSKHICENKRDYYSELERASRGSMDVTPWVTWFLGRLELALKDADGVLAAVRRKQLFWDAHGQSGLNERQAKVVNMLLEGFRGNLQTAKYAKIAKCSPDSALRDLADLVNRGILERGPGGGRSTTYVLVPQFSPD